VLLVEDEHDLRETLSRVLADEGFAVDQAADGEEGLHQALGVGTTRSSST
jgi:DNA-binding response OmpR family regulator